MTPAIAERVVLVTGGAQGIGRAVAERLMRDGVRVVIFDKDLRPEERGHPKTTHATQALRVDVSSEDDVRAGFEQIERRFGRLDGLVNNAGIADPHGPELANLTLEAWHRVIDSHLTGAFLCVKYALPLLSKAPGAAIVNIASTRALQSEPHCEAYAAAKGGMVALTHALAVSLGPTVRVNAISPGWIDTREFLRPGAAAPPPLRDHDHAQHPVGRVGAPPDVAALTEFLLSSEAGFITGQNFLVDGGMTRKMIYEE